MKESWNSIVFIHRTLCFLLFFSFIIKDVYAAPSRHLCHPEQRDTLLMFKNEFKIYKATCYGILKTESWKNNSDCCTWNGITCDANSGDVIELNLRQSCLTGQLNSKSNIFRFQGLRILDLCANYLSGQIPSSLANFSKLTTLDLSINHFNGQIPFSLSNLSHLKYLNLGLNNFTGEIPSDFGRLNELVELELDSNKLNGNFPLMLLNLTKLSRLLLLSNQLTGTLPPNMSSLSKLEFFDVSRNAFTGALPPSLFAIPKITQIDVRHNQLNGTLDFGNLSSTIEVLYLGNNKFRGPIPRSIVKLVNLRVLDLSFLNTQGSVDSSVFSHLKSISLLYLSHLNTTTTIDLNDIFLSYPMYLDTLDLSGNHVSSNIMVSVSEHPSLTSLNLSRCGLSKFPEFLRLPYKMQVFDISNNEIKGRVPGWFWSLPNLMFVDISNNKFIGHNQLVGKLPRSLVHISSLQVLNVENNKFNDTFPFWLSSLQELQVLVLRSNAFHGPIQKIEFSKLRIIDISGNHFNGTLPSDFFVKWIAMISLGITEDKSNGEYMGTNNYYSDSMVLMNKGIAVELVRILKVFTAVDFSGNRFVGEIPSSIGLLKELHVLNLSNNAFTGHIPSTMANLIQLESLDVSQNKLSGEIPQELGKLTFLSYMDFSHNQLVGPITESTQFQTQHCSSFEGNLGLFGPTLDRVCADMHKKTSQQSEMREEEEDEEEVISWRAAAIGAIPGLSFGFMIGYVLLSNKSKLFIKTFAKQTLKHKHHNSLER